MHVLRNLLFHTWVAVLVVSSSFTLGFTPRSSGVTGECSLSFATQRRAQLSVSFSAASSPTPNLNAAVTNNDEPGHTLNWNKVTAEWELDCYSRPVLVEGKKKLWEILMTDSSGSMRICKTLPSNKVNSREVRRVVEDIIDQSDVKPDTIRFFRGAMFNMINIALSEIDVIAKPSRCTFALAQWIEERNRDVYPEMEGYQSTMSGIGGIGGTFLDIRTAVKLPGMHLSVYHWFRCLTFC